MSPEFTPLLIAAPVLVIIAASDFRHMLIPNLLVLLLIGIFAISAPVVLEWHEIALRLAIAGAVFVVCLLAFIFNVLAGGDVKALSALMLFVPTSTLSTFAFTFSAAMLIGIVLTLVLRGAFGSPKSKIVTLATTRGYPMGVSISLAGLLLPLTAGF